VSWSHGSRRHSKQRGPVTAETAPTGVATFTPMGGAKFTSKGATLRVACVIVTLSILLAACSNSRQASASSRHKAAPTSTTGSTTTSVPRATPTTQRKEPPPTTTTSIPPTTLPPSTTETPPTAAPTTQTTAAPPPPPTTSNSLLVNRLIGVGDADQIVAVVANGYFDTTATMTAYQRGANGWTQVFGPWTAEIGEDGFAPPGQKVEGDLRTPSGSYGFGFFFGIDADPGVSFPWRPISSSDVWDDDPSSALYNQWVDEATQGVAAAGADPEPMYDPPYYYYGAVIDYNMYPVSHTPPDGSAIFFHYSPGPTVGCVALPEISELLAVLKWLNPDDDPRIIMGTESAVVS
jgi:L,D-peptidoglycan transpeptidase YkuD (ErfK/YbiS/YcfS/YnhG family)